MAKVKSTIKNKKAKEKHTKKPLICNPPVPSLTHGYPSHNLQFQNMSSEECEIIEEQNVCPPWNTKNKGNNVEEEDSINNMMKHVSEFNFWSGAGLD